MTCAGGLHIMIQDTGITRDRSRCSAWRGQILPGSLRKLLLQASFGGAADPELSDRAGYLPYVRGQRGRGRARSWLFALSHQAVFETPSQARIAARQVGHAQSATSRSTHLTHAHSSMNEQKVFATYTIWGNRDGIPLPLPYQSSIQSMPVPCMIIHEQRKQVLPNPVPGTDKIGDVPIGRIQSICMLLLFQMDDSHVWPGETHTLPLENIPPYSYTKKATRRHDALALWWCAEGAILGRDGEEKKKIGSGHFRLHESQLLSLYIVLSPHEITHWQGGDMYGSPNATLVRFCILLKTQTVRRFPGRAIAASHDSRLIGFWARRNRQYPHSNLHYTHTTRRSDPDDARRARNDFDPICRLDDAAALSPLALSINSAGTFPQWLAPAGEEAAASGCGATARHDELENYGRAVHSPVRSKKKGILNPGKGY